MTANRIVLTVIIVISCAFGDVNRNRTVLPGIKDRPVWEENLVCFKLAENIPTLTYGKSTAASGIRSLDKLLVEYEAKTIRPRFKVNSLKRSAGLPDLTSIYLAEVEEGVDLVGFIAELEKNPNVVYAERVACNYFDEIPSDSLYSLLTHLPQIYAEQAWDIHHGEDGAEEVVIGIVDSGIDWKHPDLISNIYNNLGEDADGDGATLMQFGGMWYFDLGDINGIDDDNNGYIDDFIGWNMYANENGDQSNDPMESVPSYHGTHVSGLAAGVTNNVEGIAAISWNVKIMVTSHAYSGGISVYNPYDGIIYLAENGADIINTSWGGLEYTQAAKEVIDYALGLGCIIVGSAGNTGGSYDHYPSDFPGVVCVAAVGPDDYITYYTNVGLGVDISVPGGDQNPGLLSTYPGGDYLYSSGTSMASPVAAGALALLKSYHPDWTNDELIHQFLATTDDIYNINYGFLHQLGHGRLNAYRMMNESAPQLAGGMRLAIHEVQSTNPNMFEHKASLGDTASLSFVIRNYTMFVEDSNVTFTLTSDNPHILISDNSYVGALAADDFSQIDSRFFIEIAPEATSQISNLILNVSPATAEVSAGASLEFPLIINTINVAEAELEVDVEYGDTAVESLTLVNSGEVETEYQISITDPFPNFSVWHLDTINAYDGNSWWCGIEEIMEYPYSSCQILDLPVFDLSATTTPLLTFMAAWEIEEPSKNPPYDGWDAANVWISTDGGFNYTPLRPDFPAYTCESVYAFGQYFVGDSIPGWAGSSGGWVPVQFDLSPYRNERVSIRLVMASDPVTEGLGFFADNILVDDSGTTIYQNTGEDDFKIRSYASSAYEYDSPWLSVDDSDGLISANSSINVPFNIDARDLTVGGHTAMIRIATGDISIAELDCRLFVTAPNADIGLRNYSLSNGDYRVARDEVLTVTVDNYGQTDASQIQLTASLMLESNPVWTDTITIDALDAQQFARYSFKPYFVSIEGDLELNIALAGYDSDVNQHNDILTEDIEISTLVDPFTWVLNPIWNINGWGFTDMSGYQDGRSMHCNAGVTPYQSNMDNFLAYEPGINMAELNSLAIKYYALYQLEDNVDFGTFEISLDQENWTVLNTHTGTDIAWSPQVIDLTGYCGAEHDSLWFRFHFTSDGQNEMLGYFIDHVQFLVPEGLSTSDDVLSPKELSLSPNYPNPFNPITNINYSISRNSMVELKIYDLLGKEVNTLVSEIQGAGNYSVIWDATNYLEQPVSSGVYLYQLKAENRILSGKMVLLK